jgi:LytS/YehU family sensor histidine kinase
MKTVHAYLDLEKIRFEERLNYSFDIPAELNSVQLPPMLIQTLVENAIKHGISDLPLGGDVIIDARKLNEALLEIRVMNSGKYDPIRRKKSTSNGIGLTNSRRRLQLLYGTKSNIAIYNEGDRVICDITIPLTPKSRFAYEDSDN